MSLTTRHTTIFKQQKGNIMNYKEMREKGLNVYTPSGAVIDKVRSVEEVDGGINVKVLAETNNGASCVYDTDDAVEFSGFVKGAYIK